jgi:hypothetical protein
MQQESRDPQLKVEPKLLPAPPSYLLLGPPRIYAPAPDLPLSDLVSLLTQRLLQSDAAALGDQVKAAITALNRQLTSRDGQRTYYAYPTESLERLQKQLAFQGRSAANLDEGQAWRNLSRAFASAIQHRGEGG